MKILLVNPYFGNLVYAPTLGLGFLASYLKSHAQCEVEVVEPVKNRLDEAKLLAKVKQADILALTCYTESRFQCFDFAQKAKRANPHCRIVVGGTHATVLSELILTHYPYVDLVVRLEGEKALLDIVQGSSLDQIPNLTWRSDKGIVRNPDGILDRQIDHFQLDYALIWPEIKDWKDGEIPHRLQKLRHLPIIASRGCPFRCSFCAAHRQWVGGWRGYSPEKLVKMISQLVEQYQIGYFRFYDALFVGNEKHTLEFCDLLEKADLKIKFRIDIRAGTGAKVLKRLREVGCEVVGLGIESGSEKTLKRINKMTTRQKIQETIEICKALDYWLIGFFMMSLPDETWADFQETLKIVKYFDVFNFQFFKIHPNTMFYDELKQRGEIKDEIWFDKKYGEEIFYSRELFPSANFYRRDLGKIEKSIYLKYDIRKPMSTINRYGWAKGTFKLLASMAQLLMLSNDLTASYLDGVKKSWLGKLLKSRRFLK